MDEPIWISARLALAIHDEQLAEHGGLMGVREFGALDSALHRPVQLFSYGQPDVAALAGAYAFGIARNHPFSDGNKRTSLVVSVTFLALNGFSIEASDDDKLTTWLALADGSLDEAGIAAWLRQTMQPLGSHGAHDAISAGRRSTMATFSADTTPSAHLS